jgi:hypothetical protein
LLANRRIIHGENMQANTFFTDKLYQWMLDGYIEKLKKSSL